MSSKPRLLEVGPDQLQHRTGALAGDEPEVHLHERLGGDDGLGARTRVAGLYARDVRGRAQQHLAQRVLAGELRGRAPPRPRTPAAQRRRRGCGLSLRGPSPEGSSARSSRPSRVISPVLVLDRPAGPGRAARRGSGLCRRTCCAGRGRRRWRAARRRPSLWCRRRSWAAPPRPSSSPPTGRRRRRGDRVGADEGRQVGAADLLLALDEELQLEGQWAVLLYI